VPEIYVSEGDPLRWWLASDAYWGTALNVPEETAARWRSAFEVFDKTQDEIEAALKAVGFDGVQ
jgi:hypothetical protein